MRNRVGWFSLQYKQRKYKNFRLQDKSQQLRRCSVTCPLEMAQNHGMCFRGNEI